MMIFGGRVPHGVTPYGHSDTTYLQVHISSFIDWRRVCVAAVAGDGREGGEREGVGFVGEYLEGQWQLW